MFITNVVSSGGIEIIDENSHLKGFLAECIPTSEGYITVRGLFRVIGIYNDGGARHAVNQHTRGMIKEALAIRSYGRDFYDPRRAGVPREEIELFLTRLDGQFTSLHRLPNVKPS